MHSLPETTKKNWNSKIMHPLQSWQWGEFRQKMGITVAYSDSFLLTFHKLPFLPFTIGYFPKGKELSQEIIRKLKQIGQKHRAIYIQIEPNIKKSDQNALIDSLKPSHRPLFTKFTFLLDISPSEDKLLSAFHSKTRYNIKVAQKHGVVIKQDNSEEAFSEYLRLVAETTKRQGFYAHSVKYTQTMWDTLSPSGLAQLFTATYKGKVLAAWIIFALGDTLYYPYGASSRDSREVMAPTLLLWEIVRWGKANGYKHFDLWGALGDTPDPKDPWYGFHRFKEGFRPELVEFVGSFDIVLNPLLYKIYCLVDSLRWKILKALR